MAGITEKTPAANMLFNYEHGKPLIFGKNRDKGIRRNPMATSK